MEEEETWEVVKEVEYPDFILVCPDPELKEKAKQAYVDDDYPDREMIFQQCLVRKSEVDNMKNHYQRENALIRWGEFIQVIFPDPNSITQSKP